MRDWREYVRERLAASRQDDRVDEEVVQELAEHLEDVYTELCASGCTQVQALRQTARQAGNWLELQQGIEAARPEGAMNERVRKFWLPSLVTLLLGWGILAIMIWAGVEPWMTHPAEARGLIVYVPWLVMLPLIGAMGSYLAHWSNAKSWQVYVVAAFPAVAAALVFLTVFPWAVLVDRNVGPDFRLVSLAANTISWVILPGIALLTGVAFERLRKAKRAGV